MASPTTAAKTQPDAPAAPPAPILETRKLVKRYPNGDVLAVDNVSLSIEPGEYVSIMGPSGSGKSTLMNLLGGLDTPTSGEVLFQGKPYGAFGSLDALRAKHLGYVFQSFHLLPTLTALENVQVPMFESSRTAPERQAAAVELLKLVHMEHRAGHSPLRLSVGERQRVAIARSLANNPEVLLADEPTGNLDSKNGAEVLDLFDKIHREHGVTLVVITHGGEVAERAERLLTYRDGRVVADQRR
ncbi:Lipoprotein-releasing system ATP-binding protein LolD [Posidoniimonas polymericola]|uniref:Lipoprotein-releasing system ATP-binding protein LolD n=1 Tax=Posidoniimonas polymericola TaxID=2528002 RepID=A0A5C5YU71_9BACT|nr:ABC transporter ATP-binding protein [Posidoniimonas polymericola]TWT78572.1 Lipoprotein-releasing system ATP-binding protein LolD [Posidoniimonas polymericola]